MASRSRSNRGPISVIQEVQALHIDRLDHLVLTITDIPATYTFCTRILGMREVAVGDGRKALAFGDQKINLHQAGHEFEPKALRRLPG
jgi:catechol 2,3-dioxygenase-like lactoylglutathione lyase family enzyme